MKPEVYPKVEDEATIILAYPQTQAIIQASWNWPFDRRDLAVYGRTGYVLVPQRDLLRMRQTGTEESELDLPAPPIPVRPATIFPISWPSFAGKFNPPGCPRSTST